MSDKMKLVNWFGMLDHSDDVFYRLCNLAHLPPETLDQLYVIAKKLSNNQREALVQLLEGDGVGQ